MLSILKPVLEIAEALLGGALLGVLFTVMLRFFKVQSLSLIHIEMCIRDRHLIVELYSK